MTANASPLVFADGRTQVLGHTRNKLIKDAESF
jgi:hypothetical protein